MLNSLSLLAEANVIGGVIFLSIMAALVGFIIWGSIHVARTNRQAEETQMANSGGKAKSPRETGTAGLVIAGVVIIGLAILLFIELHRMETGEIESFSMPAILHVFYQIAGKWGAAGSMFLLGGAFLFQAARRLASRGNG